MKKYIYILYPIIKPQISSNIKPLSLLRKKIRNSSLFPYKPGCEIIIMNLNISFAHILPPSCLYDVDSEEKWVHNPFFFNKYTSNSYQSVYSTDSDV